MPEIYQTGPKVKNLRVMHGARLSALQIFNNYPAKSRGISPDT